MLWNDLQKSSELKQKRPLKGRVAVQLADLNAEKNTSTGFWTQTTSWLGTILNTGELVCIKEQQTWPNHNIWQQQATNHVGIDLLLVASYFLWRILCSLGRTRERACYHKRVRNTNIMTTKDGNKQRTMGSIRLCTNLWIVAICVLGGGDRAMLFICTSRWSTKLCSVQNNVGNS